MFLHWSFNIWFGMITNPSRRYPESTRHPPDIFQTPSNLSMLALWRASVGKAVVEYDDEKWFLSIAITSIQSWQYPGSIRHHPDTIQLPQCIGQKLETSNTSEHIWLRANNSLIGCYWPIEYWGDWIVSGGVWRVSGRCLIDPGYCQDFFLNIIWNKKSISLYSTIAFPSRG